MSYIDSSWNAYNDSDADWNANLMNTIVGLERYYGAKRSAQTEGKIQMLFPQLDNELAALRRSDIVKELRAGALLQRCWRVGILREFGAKGFRFSCWERIMPFKILWGGG